MKEMKELLDRIMKMEKLGSPSKDIEQMLVNTTREALIDELNKAKTSSDFRKFTILCAKALLEDYEMLSRILQEERDKQNGN